MKRYGTPFIIVIGLVVVLGIKFNSAGGSAQGADGAPAIPTHRFKEVADGVYFAEGTGPIFTQSNSMVVVNESDVLVVDSHVTPAAARALLASIETLTDKPVRYLVNTHYHFDHAHGNQAFGPDVQIIGHEYTREKLLGDVLNENTYLSFTSAIPDQIEQMKKRLEEMPGGLARVRLAERIHVQENHVKALAEIVPTPPTVTLEKKMTLHLGGREIQLHFMGRGHTGGDVVVFLPKEKVIFTGDLLLPSVSYMGDGFVDEWDETLEAVKELDFDIVLPGHGQPFKDRARIDNIQAYLRDLWKAVSDLRGKGLSAADAAERVDLTKFRTTLGIVSKGADPRAVSRIYQLLAERN